VAFAFGLAAANLTGTWTLKSEKDVSGHPGSYECAVQQEGGKLRGICGSKVNMADACGMAK
jgi:hypothetical protein